MADQDIFIENALPSDSNFAQWLDSLACVSLLISVVCGSVHLLLPMTLTIIVAIAFETLAGFVRWWKVRQVGDSAKVARNDIYEVTRERLKILHSQVDANVYKALQSLEGRPMSGLELVESHLAHTVPKKDLLRAMPVLLQTLLESDDERRGAIL